MINFRSRHYKAIICDFDGTLTGKDLMISGKVKEAIRQLAKSNILFLIATGRSYNGLIEQACKELALTTPQITRGGSEIVDPATSQVIHAELISDSDLPYLIKTLDQLKVSYAIEKGQCIYTKEGKPIWEFGPVPFRKIEELEMKNIPKIVIFPFRDHRKEDEFEEVLKRQSSTLHITKSYSPVGKSWDITSAMANKQEGVIQVARLLDIKREEIIGIGDGYNDFPLLEACGYKVAMGNAHQELKEIADEVIPSYEENGVAVFINQLLV